MDNRSSDKRANRATKVAERTSSQSQWSRVSDSDRRSRGSYSDHRSRVTDNHHRSRASDNDRRSRDSYSDHRSRASYGDHNRNRFIDGGDRRPRISDSDIPQTMSPKSAQNNLQQRLDEITVLQSIFDDSVLTVDDEQLMGRFLAEPVLKTNELIVCYRDGSEVNEFCVQHLPPIELYFELPSDYPSKSNPLFLISCKWIKMSELELICEKLESLWRTSKMEILFTWFSFLQNEAMDYLRISDRLDITSIIQLKPKWITKSSQTQSNSSQSQSKNLTTLSKASLPDQSRGHSHQKHRQYVIELKPHRSRGSGALDRRAAIDLMGRELVAHLKAYNEYKRKETFNKSYISCNICFSSHLGEDCVVFPCNHINCKTCITNYFITLIKDGTVNQLKCPDTECQTSAPPNLVRELIPEDLFKKYDKLMLESVIGSMSDVHYCPRKTCGTLVIGDTDSQLAHCSACGHAFCKNCKYSYHGVDPCNMFRDAQQRKVILEKYSEANATEKQELEKIYGKKQLASALEEAATDRWIDDMAKRCPHCKACIEKSDGCNKMSCWRCNTYFCWICLTQLPVTQPYSHFNNPDSKCFNQLFRGVNLDVDDMFEDFVI